MMQQLTPCHDQSMGFRGALGMGRKLGAEGNLFLFGRDNFLRAEGGGM
jgi:hypothetical protein